MINIQKMIEQANQNGYQGDNASAKVCQDIVLKALATGPLRVAWSCVVRQIMSEGQHRIWLDDEIDVITEGLLEFVSKI